MRHLLGMLIAGACVSASATAQGLLLDLPGTDPGGGFGDQVSFAGDLNGDGQADLLVAGTTVDGPFVDSGVVRVHSGSDGAVLYEWHGGAGDRLGAVAGAGDTNGDGFADIVIGAWADSQVAPSAGAAWIRSGQSGAVLHAYYGTGTNTRLGAAVDGGGDADLDGFADVVIAVPKGGAQQQGLVHLVSGRNGSISWTSGGSADQFGTEVAFIGDVTGDGRDDVAGTTFVVFPNNNRVHLRSGLDGSSVASFDVFNSFPPIAVDAAGDVDGDGTPDIVVGYRTTVKVFSGTNPTPLWTTQQLGLHDFGISVAGAGDFDGDGKSDVMIGTLQNSSSVPSHVAIVSGETGGEILRIGGETEWAGDRFGWSVDGGFDVDVDGRPDVLIGAVNSGQPGYAQVWSECGGAKYKYWGDGCPGSGGFTPRARLFGCALAGGANTLSLDRALGGAAAILLLGDEFADVSLPSGCSLLVKAPSLHAFFFTMPGAGAAGGELSVPVGIPASSVAFQATVQLFVADPNAPGQWASSRALGIGVP